ASECRVSLLQYLHQVEFLNKKSCDSVRVVEMDSVPGTFHNCEVVDNPRCFKILKQTQVFGVVLAGEPMQFCFKRDQLTKESAKLSRFTSVASRAGFCE